jgi:hypothetical protein
VRDGIVVRLDHSLCLRHALEGLPPEAIEAFRPLGYEPADFQTEFFDCTGDNPVWIFSNWVDGGLPVYRHKATGIPIPFQSLKEDEDGSEQMLNAMSHLEANFERTEYGEKEMKETLRSVFERIPENGKMFVLLPPEGEQLGRGEARQLHRRRQFNRWVTDVAESFACVQILPIGDFVESTSEIKNANLSHFDRRVYFRIYEHIVQAAGRNATDAVPLPAPQVVSAVQ